MTLHPLEMLAAAILFLVVVETYIAVRTREWPLFVGAGLHLAVLVWFIYAERRSHD